MHLPLFRKPADKGFNILFGILALAILALAFFKQLPVLWFLLPLCGWICIQTWAVFTIQLGYFITTFNKKNTSKKQIAITFDDGPHQQTEQILQLLKEKNAKATFFLIGKNAEQHPSLVEDINSDGHQIGNHTYSHKKTFPILKPSQMVEELAMNNILLKRMTGKNIKLFRPPFGITNPWVARAVNKLGFTTIGWSVRSLDTVIKEPEKLVNRIKSKTQQGDIVLLHDHTPHVVFVLEQILDYFSEQEYEFVTVDQLMS